jgi:hypothetical protein
LSREGILIVTQQLQEREEAIREAAMELAGQCTALLLKALSEDQMALDEASQRTRESRGFGSQSQGKKVVKVQTVGNVEVSLNGVQIEIDGFLNNLC